MLRPVAGVLFGVCGVWAQTAVTPPMAFEVASVKPSHMTGEGSRRERVESTPGSLIMANVRFGRAMQWAYSVQDYQINGPGWINDERFDIVAKAANAAPENQLRTMLQALLAERFKLAIHRQTKEMSAYVVLIAKEGHKLKESTTEGPSSLKPSGKFGANAERADLDEMAALISQPLQAPVINMTGLKGRFDFSVDLTEYITPELLGGKHEGGGPPPDLISIAISALQKQLGLKLESRKMPVEILVIDHAEKAPTEN
jgi:uncharacterized protein (TIGR03435 family)